jgi:hypothetical protein
MYNTECRVWQWSYRVVASSFVCKASFTTSSSYRMGWPVQPFVCSNNNKLSTLDVWPRVSIGVRAPNLTWLYVRVYVHHTDARDQRTDVNRKSDPRKSGLSPGYPGSYPAQNSKRSQKSWKPSSAPVPLTSDLDTIAPKTI